MSLANFPRFELMKEERLRGLSGGEMVQMATPRRIGEADEVNLEIVESSGGRCGGGEVYRST